MLTWGWAVERLERARNYWVATTGAEGAPSDAPVWGLWVDDAVIFGTNPRSAKGRNLARDPRAVVHLESGDDVVILHGAVESAELDARLADLYQAKYDFRPETSEDGWYRLPPRVALAWLERDYTKTATRFTFDV